MCTHDCAEERGIATPSEEEYACIVFIVLVFTFASGVYHLRVIYFFIISTAFRGHTLAYKQRRYNQHLAFGVVALYDTIGYENHAIERDNS